MLFSMRPWRVHNMCSLYDETKLTSFSVLKCVQSYIGMFMVLLGTSVMSVGLVQFLSYLPGGLVWEIVKVYPWLWRNVEIFLNEIYEVINLMFQKAQHFRCDTGI